MRGYKILTKEMMDNGVKYELNTTYSIKIPSTVKKEQERMNYIFTNGYHFSRSVVDCFSVPAYSGLELEDIKICLLEASGEFAEQGLFLACTNIRLIQELSIYEIKECIEFSKAFNIGTSNSGTYNVGTNNQGNNNIGNNNAGSFNIGDRNTGSLNVGALNSGVGNSGDCNLGNFNSGRSNQGSYNCGSFNVSSYNSGCFNTEKQQMRLFNQYLEMTVDEFINSLDYSWDELLRNICLNRMTEDDWKHVEALPNYDEYIFSLTTGRTRSDIVVQAEEV